VHAWKIDKARLRGWGKGRKREWNARRGI